MSGRADRKRAALALLAEGRSQREVSRLTGKALSTIQDWIKAEADRTGRQAQPPATPSKPPATKVTADAKDNKKKDSKMTQADHPNDGAFNRRVRLVVIDQRGPRWMPDGKTPKSRSECPDTSVVMCGAIHCRFHLLRIDGADRAGRPSIREVKRDARGWTIAEQGDLGDERAATTLEPRWLTEHGEFRFAETCALDVAARGPQTNEEIAAATARHRTLVARLVRRAIRIARERGVTAEGLRLAAGHEAEPGESRAHSSRPTRGIRRAP